MGAKSFKHLTVWQESFKLALDLYKYTKTFPVEEKYGLTTQMRRAAVSIPSNIAEGFKRYHNKEYVQFLRITMGSCAELETQVLITKELTYLKEEDSSVLIERINYIGKMLSNLIKRLN